MTTTTPTYAPRGWQAIKDFAGQLGVHIPELLATDRSNDPFFAGSPTQVRMAEWFADLFRQFRPPEGARTHLRRLHYAILSRRNVTWPDGSLYGNTTADWK